jgi:hypothetical protein
LLDKYEAIKLFALASNKCCKPPIPTILVAIFTKTIKVYVATSSQKLATLKSSTRWKATLAMIRQALKTNYTKELVITSLRECKREVYDLYTVVSRK